MPSVKRTNSIVSLVSRHSGRRVRIRFRAELCESSYVYWAGMYRMDSYGSKGAFSAMVDGLATGQHAWLLACGQVERAVCGVRMTEAGRRSELWVLHVKVTGPSFGWGWRRP